MLADITREADTRVRKSLLTACWQSNQKHYAKQPPSGLWDSGIAASPWLLPIISERYPVRGWETRVALDHFESGHHVVPVVFVGDILAVQR